jgi:hypothetical protein
MGHIKLWESLLDCQKTHQLSDHAFRVWIKALLTALRNGGRNGELPLRETLEFRLRMKWAEIEPAIEELHRCGLIDDCPSNHIGGIPYRIHGWDKWQTSKDSKGAERQRRWREQQASRNASRNGVGDAVEGKKVRRKEETPIVPVEGSTEKGIPEPEPAAFTLPDWVPADAWAGFMEMRGRKKAPNTDRAKQGLVNKLDRLRLEGFAPGDVLDQSTERGYTGVFPIHVDYQSQATQPRATEEPIKYHVAPADSPFRAIEQERRAKLFALFGGQPSEVGQAPAAQPGGGEGGLGVMSAG